MNGKRTQNVRPTPWRRIIPVSITTTSPNYGRDYIVSFHKVYPALAAKYHVALVPFLLQGVAGDEALNQKEANLFSDLAVHHMGSGLADNVTQGDAGPDEFRTAPLWGIGQRAFFLHDGRTKDLLEAILAHAGPGSEASRVIDLFRKLNATQKQDVLNFLRSR